MDKMKEKEEWWQATPNHFESFVRELDAYETLGYTYDNGKIVVTGSWAVFGETSLITRYEIKIILPDDFPNSFPVVFEVGGRIPRSESYHINSNDGSCCLVVEPEIFVRWPNGLGIREFLNGPLKEFFFSQAYFEMAGVWPFGEWSHGNIGILEYYAEFFGIQRLYLVGKFLHLAQLPKMNRQWKCPCGSRKRAIHCHANKMESLKKIMPQAQISQALEMYNLEISKLQG